MLTNKQEQTTLTADQQLASRQALQPLEAAQQFGSGVTQLIAGYPGREVIQPPAPAPSPLATGLRNCINISWYLQIN